MRGLDAVPGVCLIGRRRREITARRAIDGYWRRHVLRADRLARALAALSGAPEGWSWAPDGAEDSRKPPLPYRIEPKAGRPRGGCVVCGQPVYRLGWHRDLWGDGAPSSRASWHACCAAAYRLWIAPSEFLGVLKRRQRRRCAVSGERLLSDAGEVDHRIPLHRIRREHRDTPWPALLGFWGGPNLQVLSAAAHRDKCLREARERRAPAPAPLQN